MNTYFILGIIFAISALMFGYFSVRYAKKDNITKAIILRILMWVSITIMWLFFIV